MIKRITLLFAILFCCETFGQTVIDTVEYRFVYDAQYKVTERSRRLKTDEHRLEIGRTGVSKYYSYWKDQSHSILDSIFSVGGNHNDIDRIREERSLGNSSFNYYVYKNHPQKGIQSIDLQNAEYFLYTEDMGQDWQLADGDTILLNYPCKKAITNYHGRAWEVWYTLDIPIAEGPWKLCGLPGLILRAIDSKREFIFNCIGIYNNVNEPLTFRNKKFKVMEANKVHKLIKEIDADPFGYENMKYGSYGTAVVIDAQGKEQIFKPKKYVYIENY